MKRNLKVSHGFTLVEVLISATMAVALLTASASTILNGQFLTSCSKHKIQAMYAAQQILEQQRRLNFSAVSSQTTAPVTLDTHGNFNDSSGYFYGTAITTVTNLDAYRNQVKVEIDWPEQVLAAKITMRECYSTNIANDSIPN